MNFLAIISDAYGGYGGIAQYNRDFFEALSSAPSCQSITVVPRHIPNAIDRVPQKIRHVLPKRFGKLGFIVSSVFTALKSQIFGPRYDSILCGHILLVPVAILVALLVRRPAYLFLYGFEVWDNKQSRISNWLLPFFSGFISISEFTTNQFVRWSGVSRDKIHYFPCAVDLERFCPGEQKKTLIQKYGLENKFVLLTVSRLHPLESKGHDEVLLAMHRLKEELPNLVYLIVGDGDKQFLLEKKVRDLGLEKNIVFAGRVSEEDKVAHYRLADLYLMPSRGEGFGIVLIEAAACGIPVIGSKVDASKETLLEGRVGKTVDPNNVEDLVAQIRISLQSPLKASRQDLEVYSKHAFTKRVHDFVRKAA